MSKQTLLEMTQDILNDIDGDFVNSIFDTEESEQVAQIIKSTYRAMMSNRNWPHTARLISITPSSDSERPTHMSINEDIKELISIYYDKKKAGETKLRYLPVEYLPPDRFLIYTNRRNSDISFNSIITDPTGVKIIIQNNKAPEYYTSFDDNTILFDSFDNAVDSTLQASKIQARAYTIPEFSMLDDFVPDLPSEAFSALIEEAKSKAAAKIAQKEDVKAEQESSRQNRWLSRKAWRVSANDIYPDNYGRKRNRYQQRDSTFRRDE